MGEYDKVVKRLLKSAEPSIRYKVRVGVLGEDSGSTAIRRLRGQIRRSDRVQKLLANQSGMYRKWTGTHWVLSLLGDLGHPEGDRSLSSIVDQGLDWAMSQKPRQINGRPRRCCSQEGNALLYAVRLGFVDERCNLLAQKILACQWPDGGWNCDKKPEACHASFNESLIPMHALYTYGKLTGKRRYVSAARRASEMFLDRRLFRRKTTGEIIKPRFAVIHYPYFWQYSFLYALVVMAKMGRIRDVRCREPLDLLVSKRREDGGFPAERKYYSVIDSGERYRRSGQTVIAWGPVSARTKGPSNDFVTVDTLTVLKTAGRI
jgi:hypothetical protein